MALDLFKFVDCLFDVNQYKNVTNQDKKSNFFMVQRFMSIKFPLEADFLNVIGINEIHVMDHWHRVLTKKYHSKPGWIYTKSQKKEKIKNKIDSIDKETISIYLKLKKMDRRDFDFKLLINQDDLVEELKKLEVSIKNNSDFFKDI